MDLHTKLAIARVLGCVAFQVGKSIRYYHEYPSMIRIEKGLCDEDVIALYAAFKRGWRDAQIAAEWQAQVEGEG